ncbi:MAG: PrgI family protein [Candidatus Levybacteria bacterium]|nr:PrgI family protein [Candidatus Levybacteria bacterium]
MENHPIPQDVTGFQFKLIGDMTIKQFAYLITGVIMAWIFFSLSITYFIKIPFAFFFGLFGVSLAFLPIEGRPMDVMIGNFLKALSSPTQYVYKKTGVPVWSQIPIYRKTLQGPSLQTVKPQARVFLQTSMNIPKNDLDKKELSFFQSLFGQQNGSFPQAPQNTQAGSPVIITMHDDSKKEEPKKEPVVANTQTEPIAENVLQEKAALLERELQAAKEQEANLQKQAVPTQAIHEKTLELEKQLAEVLTQKEQLTGQLINLQQKLDQQKKQFFTPGVVTSPKIETKNVKSIPGPMGKSVGLPITPDVPNLITGILKNPRNMPLPNILVEVKDSEGNPVRAFKTNSLGQFASATPLLNGTYTMEFEDPKGENKFDFIEIKANGEIILPIEVISIDTREELRKSLFGEV